MKVEGRLTVWLRSGYMTIEFNRVSVPEAIDLINIVKNALVSAARVEPEKETQPETPTPDYTEDQQGGM